MQSKRESGHIGPRTQKQADFLRFYLKSHSAYFNATKAAIMAGYSPKTAYSIGHELTKKPRIKAVIDAHRAEEAHNYLKMRVDAKYGQAASVLEDAASNF